MSDYNAKVLHEQGGSVLRVDSGGSINVQAGGGFFLGNNQILFGTLIDHPAVSAKPGSIFLRTDGSASNFYVNTSDGTAGSVWASASIDRPA